MPRALVSSALVLATVLLAFGACSSFDDASTPASPDGGPDAPSEAATGLPDVAGEATAPTGPKYVYVFGGVTDAEGTSSARTAYRAPIQSDGSLGAWEAFPALDIGRDYAALAATPSGYLVFAGGNRTASDGARREPIVNIVEIASIDAPRAWTAAPPLPAARSALAGIAVGSRVWASGGLQPDSDFHDEIWTATVESGVLGPWMSAGTLPRPLVGHAMVALGSRLYVLGGGAPVDGGQALYAQVKTAAPGADGMISEWTDSGVLPMPVISAAVAASGLRVFVIGGAVDGAGTPASSVSVGTQEESGVLTWSAGAPLPAAARAACAVANAGVLYVFGGLPARNADPNGAVYIGRVAANGGVAWSASTSMPAPRAAHGCAVH